MATRNKYFLKAEGFGEKQVTKKEWIKAERNAGFRPKMASTEPNYMKVCATAGFTSGNMSGRTEVEYIDENIK